MSQEHDTNKSDEVKVTDEIHPEPAPFEPAYQPETLPQITVPDLARKDCPLKLWPMCQR